MIGLIAARSKNNVIGKNGKIPWKIKGEQKQFNEFDIVIDETGGEDIKYARTIYTRRNNFPKRDL